MIIQSSCVCAFVVSYVSGILGVGVCGKSDVADSSGVAVWYASIQGMWLFLCSIVGRFHTLCSCFVSGLVLFQQAKLPSFLSNLFSEFHFSGRLGRAQTLKAFAKHDSHHIIVMYTTCA